MIPIIFKKLYIYRPMPRLKLVVSSHWQFPLDSAGCAATPTISLHLSFFITKLERKWDKHCLWPSGLGSLRFTFLCCRWLSRENEVEEVKNEGPKEMTLDEWKAMQDKERTKVEFNIRKPNEGADSQWKKGYVLHKSKSEDVSMKSGDS